MREKWQAIAAAALDGDQQHETPAQVIVGLVELFAQCVAWASQQHDADRGAWALPGPRLPVDQDEEGGGRPGEAGDEDAKDDRDLLADLSP